MTATTMDGKALAAQVRAQVAREVAAFGRPIGLATVLVGDDPASGVYVRSKQNACREVGIEPIHHKLPQEASEQELLRLVAELSADPQVTGVLVQTPLPQQIDSERVMQAIDPLKDVDGFHPLNAGLLMRGAPLLLPATPAGVIELLKAYHIPLAGAHAVVVGRSSIVGKPAALLLLAEHATVTVCHSRTRELARVLRGADVLVAAIGRPHAITAEMVKPGAAVVDVGINRQRGALVGDVDPRVAQVAGFLTPVPGGVGPMTIAMLLRNTVLAAQHQKRGLAFARTERYDR